MMMSHDVIHVIKIYILILLLFLQPSTAIASQLPGQLVYTQITTSGPNCFKFTIALIMPSRKII